LQAACTHCKKALQRPANNKREMLYVNFTILIHLKALHTVRGEVTSGKKNNKLIIRKVQMAAIRVTNIQKL